MTFMVKDGIYYYGKQKLGTTKGYAIEWFNDNKDILPQIEDIYKRSIAGEDSPSVFESKILHRDGRSIDV